MSILKKDLVLEIEGLKARLKAASKAYCIRMMILRRLAINSKYFAIEDNELAAMRVMFNQQHYVDMELTCDRCQGSGDYRFPDRVAECWKCYHGRMLGRKGMMTIVDQGGEDERQKWHEGEEERRLLLEEQTPRTAESASRKAWMDEEIPF